MGAMKTLEDGNAEHRSEYEWKTASVTVPGTNGDGLLTSQAGFTTFFSTVKRAHRITIESDGTCYIRLNSATADKITITPTSPYIDNFCVVESIYVSTNNVAVALTIKTR